MKVFKENQLVAMIYKNQHASEIDSIRIGRIKNIIDDKRIAVYYHTGGTASITWSENLYPIENDYCLSDMFNSLDIPKI